MHCPRAAQRSFLYFRADIWLQRLLVNCITAADQSLHHQLLRLPFPLLPCFIASAVLCTMSWPDPPSIYKLYTPESSVPPPAPPPIPADITSENIGSFLPEHFARVYVLPDSSSREAKGSLIIESNKRVQSLTSDMFKKLATIQDDRCEFSFFFCTKLSPSAFRLLLASRDPRFVCWHAVVPPLPPSCSLIYHCSMSSAQQAELLEEAQTQMTEILSRLQEMQQETNALRVPQAHLSICAHLSRQIQSRKEQTQRVRAAAAELRSVLRRCVSEGGGDGMDVGGEAAPRMSIEVVCARLQEAVASLQHSGAIGVSAQAALDGDVPPAHSQQPASAEALGTHASSDLRLTMQGQIEALLQLPQSVLDKLPS